MNTALKHKEEIQQAFREILTPSSGEEKLELETLMLATKFLSVVEEVCQSRNILKKDLARMIGTTPSYVTQLFRGNKIINMETIARMQLALNVEFEIKLAGEQPSIDSIKIPTSTYQSLPETRLVSQVKEADPKSMKRGTSAKGPKSKKS